MVNWDNDLEAWYQYHREDYRQVKKRLRACRNVMFHGRMDSAVRMLKMSCVNAVLSIQTNRVRHERAFTMHYAGDRSLKTACKETVYGNQKFDWLSYSLTNVNFNNTVSLLRNENGGFEAAHSHLVDNFKGLGDVKAAFALAMIGVWELACPDTRTKQVLGIEGRINTKGQFQDALEQIDSSIDIDEPLFIKQWCCYDMKEQEHADHYPFYIEVLPALGH